MVEKLRDLPKHDPLRREVASQLRTARFFDTYGEYITYRNLTEYKERFSGLDAFFEQVRLIDSNGTILDIGAGSTKAISNIQYSEYGDGLTCIATVLIRPKYYDESTLPPTNVLSTSSELLHGIEDNSIAGVLSCYGLTYSEAPEHAIRRIDEVLKPGAPIKATFYEDKEVGSKGPKRFMLELEKLGYDIASEEHMGGEIVLAIKPGRETPSAQDILFRDTLSSICDILG